MTDGERATRDQAFLRRAVEISIRVGLLALLVLWCFEIVKPFIVPVIWGIIIAVALHPVYCKLLDQMGGRRGTASTVVVLVLLVLLIAPTVLLAGTLVDGATDLAKGLADGSLRIPSPPEGVAGWPIVGKPVARFWSLASTNLASALNEVGPQLKYVGSWLLSAAGNVGFGVLQFVFAIVIAGILLANARGGGETAEAIANRIMGEHGWRYADLAQSTVRGVARGILGVALIQAILAGLGFLAIGLPGAGLLAVVCLLLAVVQIGVGPIVIPAVIYVFATADIVPAVIFLVWSVFVLVIDNVLKPILLGRGARVPMAVVFVGAIGGFLAHGIIGLFVGAVVLSLGYTLFRAWLGDVKAGRIAEDDPPAP
ncbi:MAG: AI-2E family transporter [Rhodospirillales bacterium]